MSTGRTIRDGIVAALEELTGSGQLLKVVYPYQKVSTQEFPCACVSMARAPSKVRRNSNSDQLTHYFTVRVLIEAENAQEEEDQLVDLTDAIMAKFMAAGKVDTLGGLCDKLDIISEGKVISDDTETSVRGFDFTFEVSKGILIT